MRRHLALSRRHAKTAVDARNALVYFLQHSESPPISNSATGPAAGVQYTDTYSVSEAVPPASSWMYPHGGFQLSVTRYN